jgi:hypothetical protein
MIRSVELSVRVHSLDDETTEVIRKKVEDLLTEALRPSRPSQLIVTVEKYAGKPER